MLQASLSVLPQVAPVAEYILVGAVVGVAAVRSIYLGIAMFTALRTSDPVKRKISREMFRVLLGRPVIKKRVKK